MQNEVYLSSVKITKCYYSLVWGNSINCCKDKFWWSQFFWTLLCGQWHAFVHAFSACIFLIIIASEFMYTMFTALYFNCPKLVGVFIFNFFIHSVFFGGSQSPTFSKLTEIQYEGTFLYAATILKFTFPIFFHSYFFRTKFVPKSHALQIDWNSSHFEFFLCWLYLSIILDKSLL